MSDFECRFLSLFLIADFALPPISASLTSWSMFLMDNEVSTNVGLRNLGVRFDCFEEDSNPLCSDSTSPKGR